MFPVGSVGTTCIHSKQFFSKRSANSGKMLLLVDINVYIDKHIIIETNLYVFNNFFIIHMCVSKHTLQVLVLNFIFIICRQYHTRSSYIWVYSCKSHNALACIYFLSSHTFILFSY